MQEVSLVALGQLKLKSISKYPKSILDHKTRAAWVQDVVLVALGYQDSKPTEINIQNIIEIQKLVPASSDFQWFSGHHYTVKGSAKIRHWEMYH